MNKRYLALGIVALALIVAAPAISRADDGADHNDDSQKSSVREQLRSTNKEADQLMKREAEMQRKRELNAIATSSKVIKSLKTEDVKNAIREVKEDIKDARKTATSSQVRKELKRVEKLEIFKIQHARLVRQLNLALDNLKQIRDRLASRITKAEQSGRNMNEAKNLLSVADTKITAARQAVTSLIAYVPVATSTATTTATTATTTATTTIDLQKPRQLGETAIKAVKDAHKALVDVVRSIAKNMGFGNATTTPSTSPSPTSTTTATTTNP